MYKIGNEIAIKRDYTTRKELIDAALGVTLLAFLVIGTIAAAPLLQ